MPSYSGHSLIIRSSGMSPCDTFFIKNGTPALLHWSLSERDHSISIGRAFGPVSQPQIIKEIMSKYGVAPISDRQGSTLTKSFAAVTCDKTGTRSSHVFLSSTDT